MTRLPRLSAVSAAVVLSLASQCAPVMAQTATRNAQRPERTVESVQAQKLILQEATKLDALLDRGLRRHQATAQELVDDGTFVRRAYLSIVGRIPTLQETERFLADQAPDKRDTLLDLLLDSPGRTSHFANYWFDQLRVKSNQRQLNGEPFAHFIRESIQKDLPFDDFVATMLTAQGPAHEKGHGATGYLMRDTNMPHDAMANTLRLFLGTRLECAQCHNHPFDHWTQKEFYEMAAFFGGIQYRDQSSAQKFAGLRNQLANEDQRVRTRALQLVRQLTQGITGAGSGTEQLPKDYKYDDMKPGAAVLANTIFGADVKLKYPSTKASDRRRRQRRNEAAPEADSRLALAEWMTSSKNPMFAKVIANRMWARTFGRGLVEPRDDWREDTKPVHPELMDALEKLIVKLDFDLRQFERVLVHTRLFQREVEPEDPQPGVAPLFTGPVLRRMTAEQMWDSLLTLVFDDIDDRLRPLDERAAAIYQQFEELKNADPTALLAMIKEGRDPRREMAQEARRAAREQMQRDQALAKRAEPLLKELQAARRDGDLKRIGELAERLEQMGFRMGERAGRGQEGDLQRASDLPQPAAPSHLLRQFGQSDRETIDASSDAATVPQVLTLLNGFLDDKVLKGQSALARDLSTAEDGVRRVRIAFLTTLNREPTEDEIDTWRRQIAVNGIEVVRDLVWVLCNSNEFRFVR